MDAGPGCGGIGAGGSKYGNEGATLHRPPRRRVSWRCSKYGTGGPTWRQLGKDRALWLLDREGKYCTLGRLEAGRKGLIGVRADEEKMKEDKTSLVRPTRLR